MYSVTLLYTKVTSKMLTVHPGNEDDALLLHHICKQIGLISSQLS